MDFFFTVLTGGALLASLAIGLILLSKQKSERALWTKITPPPTGWSSEADHQRWMIAVTVQHTALQQGINSLDIQKETEDWITMNQEAGVPITRVLQFIRIGLTPEMAIEPPYINMPQDALNAYESVHRGSKRK